MVVTIPNNWIPRADQRPLWDYLETGGRRAVQVAHRRWGKDDVALHFTATQLMEQPGVYWHMLPQYNQGRKVLWDAINPRTGMKRIDEAFPPEIRKKQNDNEMKIETRTGSLWQVVGSDNYDSYVGSPPRGIVLSEWAISKPMAWAYLAPILEENGGWALFIYTSRGNNHGKSTYELALETDGWFAQRLPATETPVFTPDQLSGIRTEYMRIYGPELGEALFEQEYLCSWEGAIFGAYFAKQMRDARQEGRICKVPWQPAIEVYTFWDLGIDDSMAIWFMQQAGQAFNFIDYYEATGYGFEHYAKVLKDKPYVYADHRMPHDARARELSSGEVAKTRVEVAEDLGIKPIKVCNRARNVDVIINVHIPAVRNMLARCYFDEEKCRGGIQALENYRAEYDEDKKKLTNRPLHDWASHGSDAFRTFAMSWEGTQNKLKPLPVPDDPNQYGGYYPGIFD